MGEGCRAGSMVSNVHIDPGLGLMGAYLRQGYI